MLTKPAIKKHDSLPARKKTVFTKNHMNKITRNMNAIYPEILAGGFSRHDGTVEFYQRIQSLITPDMVVLDFGAGRGQQILNDTSTYRSELCKLQGKVAKVIGVDIDSSVLGNPFLDEAYVVAPNDSVPLPDNSVDLIYADWVLEHVTEPENFVSEIKRLLKSGGWFCARTPNRWGMTGIATNLVPNNLHVRLLEKFQPEREDIDVFPTAYKLNTNRTLNQYFSKDAWDNCSYTCNAEPPYVQRSWLMMNLVLIYWRLVPRFMHTVLYVFVKMK